jgi:fumarate hydratase class II
MCEMLLQVGAHVIGSDATIAFSNAFGSTLELNVMMPILAYHLLQSIELLTRGAEMFTRRCVVGLEADVERCAANIERSLAFATALVPVIGYDAAAALAKEAYQSGRNIREVALEKSGLDRSTLNRLLDPASQTRPSSS